MALNHTHQTLELRHRIDRLVTELAQQDRELAEARSGLPIDLEELSALRARIASTVEAVAARRARAAAQPLRPLHAFAVRA